MPKIIPDVREHILESARRQLTEKGFSGLSLRGVASDCGIAVGTTYNYFSSKADLASAVMKDDWDHVLENLGNDDSAREAVCSIYRAIHTFSLDYGQLIEQRRRELSPEIFARQHNRLVDSLSQKLDEVMKRFGIKETRSYLSLAAEMILAASARKDTKDEDFVEMTNRLFDGTKVNYA
jgi:AcrR family transcriptional regulator